MPMQEAAVATPHLLIVDDDVTSQAVLRMLSQRFEFAYQIASSAEEALEAYRANHAITHVLMDLKLPTMDGLECTRLLRDLQQETKRYTPIIAVTAYALQGDRERCIDAGMDDYLSKPFSIGQFLDIIARWSRLKADRLSSD